MPPEIPDYLLKPIVINVCAEASNQSDDEIVREVRARARKIQGHYQVPSSSRIVSMVPRTRTNHTALGVTVIGSDDTVLITEHDGRVDHLKFTHHNALAAADAIVILLDRAYREGFNHGVKDGGYV